MAFYVDVLSIAGSISVNAHRMHSRRAFESVRKCCAMAVKWMRSGGVLAHVKLKQMTMRLQVNGQTSYVLIVITRSIQLAAPHMVAYGEEVVDQ